MIELSRHIEALLLKHDCVIVPGLGGFVTQYVPARRIADEELFLPPFRSVGFNPDLAINDGLLAQSYMHAYDTTFPESVKLIDEAVSGLKAQLSKEGEYTLSGIGRLTLGMDGRYLFEPCEAGVISPELYGLDSVVLPEFSTEEANSATDEANLGGAEMRKSTHKPLIKRTDKTYTISVNREFVNYVAAAVVAVVFYFIWATPVSNNNASAPQTASILNSQLFSASPQNAAQETAPIYQAVSAETANAATSVATQATNSQSASEPQAAQAEQQSDAANASTSNTSSGKYTIVLASAIPQSNAEALAAKLNAQGMKNTRVYKRGRMVRVVFGAFATKDEAQTQLKHISGKTDFAEAWVMETR